MLQFVALLQMWQRCYALCLGCTDAVLLKLLRCSLWVLVSCILCGVVAGKVAWHQVLHCTSAHHAVCCCLCVGFGIILVTSMLMLQHNLSLTCTAAARVGGMVLVLCWGTGVC
jgi:hypothetical protein